MKRLTIALAATAAAMGWVAHAQDQRPPEFGRPYVAPSQTTLQTPPWETPPRKAAPKGGPNPAAAASEALRRAGSPCTLAEAAAQPDVKTPDGKTARVYEAACQEGLGYIVVVPKSGAPIVVDCLAQAAEKAVNPEAKDAAVCALAANAPSAQLGRLLKRGGQSCQPTDARYVGTSVASQTSYYEAACAGRPGVMIAVKGGKLDKTLPCASASGIGGGCVLKETAGG